MRKPADQMLSCAFLFHSLFVTIFYVYMMRKNDVKIYFRLTFHQTTIFQISCHG